MCSVRAWHGDREEDDEIRPEVKWEKEVETEEEEQKEKKKKKKKKEMEEEEEEEGLICDETEQ